MGILNRITGQASKSDDNTTAPLINVSRRGFLQGTGGLAIGLSLGQVACSPPRRAMTGGGTSCRAALAAGAGADPALPAAMLPSS